MYVCIRTVQSCAGSSYVMLDREVEAAQRLGKSRSRFFTLFQVAFSLPIAFSTSVEGSVIEVNPITLAPQDTEGSKPKGLAS